MRILVLGAGGIGGYYGARLRSPVNNLDLNLSMTFERGGKQELRVRQAEAQVTAAEAEIAANRNPEIAGDSYLYAGDMLGASRSCGTGARRTARRR